MDPWQNFWKKQLVARPLSQKTAFSKSFARYQITAFTWQQIFSGRTFQKRVQALRPTPASFCSVFLSGNGKRKIVFQVTKYKTFQKIVQTFPETWSSGSPSVFHFRNRQRFQVPGFEWVHELLLLCFFEFRTVLCGDCVW